MVVEVQKEEKINNKNMKNKHYLFIILISLGFIVYINHLDSSTENRYKTSSELRKENLENQFNPWDGSHIELTKLIKLSMNDPDSYEHIKTIYWDENTHIIILTTFRGKNMFGGVVKNYVKASFNNEGKLIEVIEQG